MKGALLSIFIFVCQIFFAIIIGGPGARSLERANTETLRFAPTGI